MRVIYCYTSGVRRLDHAGIFLMIAASYVRTTGATSDRPISTDAPRAALAVAAHRRRHQLNTTALYEWLHIGGRNQLHLVPKLDELSAPVMRPRARLHVDGAGPELAKNVSSC